MHELLPVSVQALVEASLSHNTYRAYKSAFRKFIDWCDCRGHVPLPAEPITVAEYLADLVATGRRGSTLKVHAAAIGTITKVLR